MILSRDEMKIKTKKNEKAISVFFFFFFSFLNRTLLTEVEC